jgi:hypothetical protein
MPLRDKAVLFTDSEVKQLRMCIVLLQQQKLVFINTTLLFGIIYLSIVIYLPSYVCCLHSSSLLSYEVMY